MPRTNLAVRVAGAGFGIAGEMRRLPAYFDNPVGVNFFEKNSGYFNTISKKLCEYVFAQVSWVIKHSHSVKRVSMW